MTAAIPYILPDELIAESATVIDWGSIYPGAASTHDKVMKVCREVSDTIDTITGKYVLASRKKYVLGASDDEESGLTNERVKALINTHGELMFVATYRPIVSVTSFKYAPVTVAADSMQTVHPSLVAFEGRDIVASGLYEMIRGVDLRITVQYVNGYANTVLTTGATSGTNTLVVANTTGISVGDQLEIMDDPAEGVKVTNVSSSTVTLEDNLVASHAAGIRVTEIPRDVYRAAVYLAWDIAQGHTREAVAIAKMGLMGGTDIQRPVNFREAAIQMLQPYILTP